MSETRELRDLVSAREALDDIGAHPSDVLQSNYVIWVEGPSDRVYMNYWLSVIDPGLVEGQHYSVMIYGGKLLNACSAATKQQENDLIGLFRINTHFCVLMDSDRKKKGAQVNKTKRRIVEECECSGNIGWITKWRTIENYVPEDVLADALEVIHPGKKYDHALGDAYTGPLDFEFTGTKMRPDKIAIARWVTTRGYDLPAELLPEVRKLAKSIRDANAPSMGVSVEV